MKINDIMYCINKAIEDEDFFFVLQKEKTKTIGNYYNYKFTIMQCTKHKPSVSNIFFKQVFTEQVPQNLETEVEENLESKFLTTFLTILFKSNIGKWN